VAVKVLRPGMLPAIEKDLSLMRMMAGWVESLSADGKRLKPREVVAEFDKYLHDELDLVREASSAAQLRRNMAGLQLVLIPEMLWDYCTTEVMVMERMVGVPISQVERLRVPGVDIPKLARDGVTCFSRRCFGTVFSMPTCTPATSRSAWTQRLSGAISRWTSALWARSPSLTRSTWRRTLRHFSGATTNGWPSCTSNRAGCRQTPAWTNSKLPCARV
jgi:hypothetical protein